MFILKVEKNILYINIARYYRYIVFKSIIEKMLKNYNMFFNVIDFSVYVTSKT